MGCRDGTVGGGRIGKVRISWLQTPRLTHREGTNSWSFQWRDKFKSGVMLRYTALQDAGARTDAKPAKASASPLPCTIATTATRNEDFAGLQSRVPRKQIRTMAGRDAKQQSLWQGQTPQLLKA